MNSARRTISSSRRLGRLAGAAAAVAVVGLVPAGSAGAEDYAPSESYPIPTDPHTVPPKVHKPLPQTGSDATGIWLTAGAGAVVAGGLLVAATRRQRSSESSTRLAHTD